MLLAAVLATAAVAGGNGDPPSRGLVDITVREAFALIQGHRDDPAFVILDVRTPAEFAAGHIEGAINLDYYDAGFRAGLEGMDRGKLHLVYCRSGVRSAGTLEIMRELGFQNACNMLGGFNQWLAEGLPVSVEQSLPE